MNVPEPTPSETIETIYPVHLEQEVAWGEQDKLGHVNNVVYFRYFENARLAHFLASGLSMTSEHCGPILANIHCDFLRQLTFPDRVRIEVGVSRLGRSSYTHSYRIFSQQQQAYVARGQSVTVYFDYQRQKSQPLPPELRRSLLALEGIQVP